MLRAVPSLLREDVSSAPLGRPHDLALRRPVSLVALPLLAVLRWTRTPPGWAISRRLRWRRPPVRAARRRVGRSTGAAPADVIVADVGRAVLLFRARRVRVRRTQFEHLYGVAFAVGALTGCSACRTRLSSWPSSHVSSTSRPAPCSTAAARSRSSPGHRVAGFLVQALSAPGALVMDALSFVGSGALLTRIHPEEPPPDPDRGGVRVGLRWVARSSVVRATLLATATINFFNFVFWSLFILYATRTLGVSPGTLALVRARRRRRPRRISGRQPHWRAGRDRADARSRVCAVPGTVPARSAGHRVRAVVLAYLFFAEFGSGLGVMLLDISAGSIFAAVIHIASLARHRRVQLRELRRPRPRFARRRRPR